MSERSKCSEKLPRLDKFVLSGEVSKKVSVERV